MSDGRTHYADDETIAYIAKLEDELAEWKFRALTVESSEEDAQQAAVKFKVERDNLRKLLRELHAVVVGECPALLDEDRGGNAKLALGIEDALQEAKND